MSASPISLASVFAQSAQLNQNASSAKAQATTTSGTSTPTTGGLTSSTAGTTFLSLLVKELQNQDPTAPVDSTAMVGQMISLNSLDQLISINQALTGTSGSTLPTGGATGHAVPATPAVSSASQVAQRASLLQSSPNASAIQAATQSAADPTKALDLSNLNIPNGGK